MSTSRSGPDRRPSTARRLSGALLLLLVGAGLGLASAHWRWWPYRAVQSAARAVGGLFGSGGAAPATGVWATVGDDTADAGAGLDQESRDALANIPYLRGTKAAPTAKSLLTFDAARVRPGVNLVVSGHAPEAELQDLKGNVLRRWRKDMHEVWPDPLPFEEWSVHQTFWRRAHVFPNGDLLAIYEGIGMIKIDADSRLIWANQGRCHHDLEVAEDGRIWTLSRETRTHHDVFPNEGTFLEDFILVLSPDGQELRRVSLIDCILDSDYYSLLALADRRGDLLHTNTIERIDGRHADLHPLYRRGNVLVSFPTINTIAVVDPDAGKVVWASTGQWYFQHQPTMLADGHILLFDNLGNHGKSRVVELDPLRNELVWRFDGGAVPLDSHVLGTCARLDNGNTLITQSTSGRALEVTPAGEVVWEYLNRHRAGDDGRLIANLLEVERIDPGYFAPSFAVAQSPYATGERQIDLGPVEALIDALR